MPRSLPLNLTIIGGAFLMALIVIASSLMGLGVLAIALPVIMAGGLLVFFHPFLGLLFITFFVQLDALLRLVPTSSMLTPEKLITMVALAGVILLGFRESHKLRLGRPEPLVQMAMMFGLVILTSFFFIKDLDFGLWSVRKYLSLLGMLYLTIRVVKKFSQVRLLLLVIVVSTGLSSAMVVMDYVTGTTLVGGSHAATAASYQGVSRSAGGSDYNPTTAATMNLAGTTLALILFLRMKKWRILTGPTILVGTVAIILSFARSAALVYVLLVFWLYWKFRRHRLLPVAFVIAIIVAVVAIPLIPSEYWDRLMTLVQDWKQDDSIMARISYNTVGLQLLSTHPFLGIGPGQFQYYYADPIYRFMPSQRIFINRQLHNMYLEVGTETGLVGMFLFVAMIVLGGICLNRVRKHGPTQEIRTYAEAFHYSYVGFMAVSLFMPNEYNKYVWLYIALAVAFARAVLPDWGRKSIRITTDPQREAAGPDTS